MSPAFRLARPDDLPDILELYGELHPADPPLEPERARRLWAEMLAANAAVIVAEQDEVVVATLILMIMPNLTRGGRGFAIIENVVTRAAFRGRGIARAMLRHALDRAWAADCYKVTLTTSRTDPDVLRFYEKSGFVRNSRTIFEVKRL